MKVLAAPAEFTFRASSYHVSYNLIKRIDAEFYVLASKIDETVKKELDKHVFYELNTSVPLYPLKVLLRGMKLAEKVDLIHHLSPFAIEKDFNLLALSSEKSFIIGPVEMPHKFFEDELELLRIPAFAELFRNSKLRQSFSVKTLERCDAAVAVNNQTKKHLSKFVDKKKIKVIPFGVILSKFKYSPPPDNYNILAVGFHIKRKGFDYLIKAMPKILREFPDAKLHITSKGPQTNNLKLLVKKLNLANNVIFHGRVSEEKLLQLYRQCRVFCHPSLSEAFSPVRLEAMASGRPIVATTAASGSDEMIKHGKNGFLIPPANSDAIAEVVLKLFSDYNLTYKMGWRGREKVEKEYNWDLVAKKYYDVYQEVVE